MPLCKREAPNRGIRGGVFSPALIKIAVVVVVAVVVIIISSSSGSGDGAVHRAGLSNVHSVHVHMRPGPPHWRPHHQAASSLLE